MIADDTAIDHERARYLAAAAVDGFLSPDEQALLEHHLRACPSCRTAAGGLQADARALRSIDLGDAPATTRARVSVDARRALSHGGRPSRGTALLAAALLLLAVLGVSAVGGAGGLLRSSERSPVPSGDLVAPSIVLSTDVVTLGADALWVDVADRRFRGTADVVVRSDPGDAIYRTLELTWLEHGVEMRINLYFGGNTESWWVDEIRTYNGARNGEWLVARGPFFTTPIGGVWTGTVDIPLEGPAGPGPGQARLHLSGGILAVRPADNVNEPPGGRILLRENQQLFEPGAPLHCAGIERMTPAEAERVLLALGYRLSWRLITDIEGNSSYWDPRPHAPDGFLAIDTYGTMVGSAGELIIPVIAPGEQGARPAPRPTDCPAR